MTTTTAQPKPQVANPPADKSQPPIRVLLVDDDEDYYVLTRGLLSDIEDQTYDLDWTLTYDETLSALQQTHYDVCLLDYHLGGRNGLEILQAAQAQGLRTPLIMLTGHGDREIDLAAMAAGAADYLFKANTDAALLERSIRYAIERTRMLAELRENQARLAALYEQEQAHSQELAEAYADLRRVEKLRDDLTNMIIHDLSGPLTVITVDLELIDYALQQPSVTDASRLLKNAQAAAQRMARMIDDLLDLSKLEAGEMKLNLTPVAIPALLADKQEMYRMQMGAEGKTVTYDTPEDLPMIRADATLLSRVLDNLIGNALKHTQAGSHIHLAATTDERTLTITVQDDGEGFPATERELIFNKFARGSTATTRLARSGAGLGLAFCRLAVEAHGGTITADSDLGRGATFTLVLPLRSDQASGS